MLGFCQTTKELLENKKCVCLCVFGEEEEEENSATIKLSGYHDNNRDPSSIHQQTAKESEDGGNTMKSTKLLPL